MLYLDTSVLVSMLVYELPTAQTLAWFGSRSGEPFAVSDWTNTELSSALAIKFRHGAITIDAQKAALAAYGVLLGETFINLTISASHFALAAAFCDRHATGLRAGDALHLAIASEAGATLCTRDRKQAGGGLELGIPTELLA